MKKYTSHATKWLAVAALICAAIWITGIVFMIVRFPNAALNISLTVVGGLMIILFFIFFLAENSRALTIDEEKIIFPRGADKNGKTVLQKTVIKLDDICSIESTFRKGDGIISGDCYFHSLTLKDGTKITVTLYAYGKDAEREIVETIRQSIT